MRQWTKTTIQVVHNQLESKTNIFTVIINYQIEKTCQSNKPCTLTYK